MDPTLALKPLDIPALLHAHQLRPKKGLGQNFLVDPAALRRVVAVAELEPQDVVLEIGPGLGSLTRYLCQAARRVIAVELDRGFLPALHDVLAAYQNVTIIEGDILDVNPGSLVGETNYKVVANIPYYITSAVIRHLLEFKPGASRGETTPETPGSFSRPSRIVLTVQKEVAQRICAQAGDLSLLALSVQVFGSARVAAQIPAGAFYPAPDIDSSVVCIDLFPEPVIPYTSLDRFFQLAHAGFGQKRKKLRNSLGSGLHISSEQADLLLNSAGIDPGRRAETLSLGEWKVLTLLSG